ncbi:hypothetical protein E1264_17875 [Actinomadura sp. KC216]|uniref:hypothetical protein n=1 Tax=Actinomadura sp. KC216 TaxID=2530370 RepID=UPI00104A043F|nr:hypothetical protein [Actinomadura sp. KC216]TDB86467.1 hypothetical protein E1264_17875 [Actinomadura sp. KC216]
MTISEAQAVNTILRWITGQRGGEDGRPATGDRARTEAMWLASRAHAVLGAGLTATDVAENWPDDAPGEEGS